MTTDAKQRIAAIRERVEKATPGPWEAPAPLVQSPYGRAVHGPFYCAGRAESPHIGNVFGDENAAFIAASREDVPFLLDRIVVLEKLLERAAMFIDQHVGHANEGCIGYLDNQPCTCGKRAILHEIDSWFTRSDA